MSEARSDTVATTDADLAANVDEYKAKHGYEHRSDAVKHLLEIGLRETQSPILYRLKDHVIQWASLTTVIALLVVVTSLITPFLPLGYGVQIGVTLTAVAVGLVAVFELVRAITGRNEIGARIREVITE